MNITSASKKARVVADGYIGDAFREQSLCANTECRREGFPWSFSASVYCSPTCRDQHLVRRKTFYALAQTLHESMDRESAIETCQLDQTEDNTNAAGTKATEIRKDTRAESGCSDDFTELLDKHNQLQSEHESLVVSLADKCAVIQSLQQQLHDVHEYRSTSAAALESEQMKTVAANTDRYDRYWKKTKFVKE